MLKKDVWRDGVRQLKEFYVGLLGKWCWRMLLDRGGLWYRVLFVRYSEVGGGIVLPGGRRWGGSTKGLVVVGLMRV